MALAQMRVDCPGCSLQYDVPDALFEGRTRRVRCSGCSHEWRADPPFGPKAAAWPEDAPHGLTGLKAPARESLAELPQRQAPRGRTVSDRLFLVILVVALVVAVAVVGHRAIIHVAPASAKFFAAFGLM